jgi:hypothetical protein
MYEDGIKTTKRIGKLMYLFSYLYQNVDATKGERYKYLQGTLFTLGGLLKIEAKSYLYTLK